MYKKRELGPLLGRKLYISLSRTGMPPDSELDKVLKRPSGAKTDQDDERTAPARPTAPSMVGPREQPLPPLLLFFLALGPWAKALKDLVVTKRLQEPADEEDIDVAYFDDEGSVEKRPGWIVRLLRYLRHRRSDDDEFEY